MIWCDQLYPTLLYLLLFLELPGGVPRLAPQASPRRDQTLNLIDQHRHEAGRIFRELFNMLE